MKATPFIITGLPRSRTAWLSNLLTTDNSICWHDIRFSEELLLNDKAVGFAGPELVTQFEEITRLFPDAPWLVVQRKIDDALAAFKLAAGDLLPQDDLLGVFWKDRVARLNEICSHANVTRVSYEDLNDEQVVKSIWLGLLQGIPWDSERFKLLSKLNVQQQIPQWPLQP